MNREDAEAIALVERQMTADGVNIHSHCDVTKVDYDAAQKLFTLDYTCNGVSASKTFAALFVATGRSPNVHGLGLDVAGVKFNAKTGIKVNNHLFTSNSDILAVGDVCTPYKFTHVAEAMARIAIRNALFFGSERMSDLVIPWCTYTDPELAHVGPYELDLREKGIKYDTFTLPFEENDRAILEGKDEGFVKIHVAHGTDKVLAATIVGEGAGNMISEITLMITHKVGLSTLNTVIHPYPTQADAIRRVGDLYNRTRLTPFVRTLFRKLLALRR